MNSEKNVLSLFSKFPFQGMNVLTLFIIGPKTDHIVHPCHSITNSLLFIVDLTDLTLVDDDSYSIPVDGVTWSMLVQLCYESSTHTSKEPYLSAVNSWVPCTFGNIVNNY